MGNGIKVSCETWRDAILEFPLFAYPYYQCEDSETGEEFPIEVSTVNHRIRIQMPDNYRGSVQVSFVQPWHWRMAEAVSLIAFLLLLGYGFLKRNRRELLN